MKGFARARDGRHGLAGLESWRLRQKMAGLGLYCGVAYCAEVSICRATRGPLAGYSAHG